MMDITAWSAISPYGPGTEAFATGVAARRPAGRTVPGFDPRTALGAKGTRAMNRVTALAITAVAPLIAPEQREQALVLGTSAGSAQSMMEFTRDSLTGQRPFDVPPAVIPYTVMNCAAARCAIWHGMTGPNITLAGGRACGLLGLAYARRLLLTGRADSVLCGAAEEATPARALLESSATLGEGASVLRLEPPGAPGALATVLAVCTRACPATAADVVEQVLRQAGLSAGQVWAGAPDVGELIGDTGAVSGVFQLAAVLVTCPPGQVAVLTSEEPDGMIAAAALRMAGQS